MVRASIVGALFAAVALLPTSDSQAMRCGHRLVSSGDPGAKVAALCGAPVQVERYVIYHTSRYGHAARQRHRYPLHRTWYRAQRSTTVPIVVEEWLYNRGPHRLMRTLTFENGRLVEEQTLGYGYAMAPVR